MKFVKATQPLNILDLITSIDEGKVTDFNEIQFSNKFVPNEFIVFGITIVSRDEQPLKTPVPKVVILFANVIEFNPVNDSNNEFPISVILSTIKILLIFDLTSFHPL